MIIIFLFETILVAILNIGYILLFLIYRNKNKADYNKLVDIHNKFVDDYNYLIEYLAKKNIKIRYKQKENIVKPSEDFWNKKNEE